MFGIGQTELIVFLIIVLVIFGPKNLPKLAHAIGRSVRELKNGLAGVSEELREPLSPSTSSAPKPAVPPTPRTPENRANANTADSPAPPTSDAPHPSA